MLDLLIKGGEVLDGSGNVGFRGAIGISGDRLSVHRGDVSDLAAAHVIDATGRVVCPGFIDIHTHSGLMILDAPRHEPKVYQGVTTEVVGVDGNSFAPFPSSDELARFVSFNAGIDGDPSTRPTWSSVAEYLDALDERVAVNICTFVGNSALRIASVGWTDRPARNDEIDRMCALLREGMEDGAWGLSSGLDYQPGRYADTDELVALSTVVGRLGGTYHTHIRNWLGDRFEDPINEAIEIGRRSGAATHLTHISRRGPSPGFPRSLAGSGAEVLLGRIEQARRDGQDVTFDMFPSASGGTRVLIMLPDWAQNGGPDQVNKVLRSSRDRAKLHDEIIPRGPNWQEIFLTNLRRPEHKPYEGRSVAEVAAMRGQPEAVTICDLLADDGLQVSYVATGLHTQSLPKFIAHPLSMIASDALLVGDVPTPQTYGCFPTLLGEYVRDEHWLSLPEAIRKITSFPAQRLGLPDRGLLREGMKADVVVFEPGLIQSRATRSDPRQFPLGIDHVIVNGRLVVHEGTHTGALPGRALRRGQAVA